MFYCIDIYKYAHVLRWRHITSHYRRRLMKARLAMAWISEYSGVECSHCEHRNEKLSQTQSMQRSMKSLKKNRPSSMRNSIISFMNGDARTVLSYIVPKYFDDNDEEAWNKTLLMNKLRRRFAGRDAFLAISWRLAYRRRTPLLSNKVNKQPLIKWAYFRSIIKYLLIFADAFRDELMADGGMTWCRCIKSWSASTKYHFRPCVGMIYADYYGWCKCGVRWYQRRAISFSRTKISSAGFELR